MDHSEDRQRRQTDYIDPTRSSKVFREAGSTFFFELARLIQGRESNAASRTYFTVTACRVRLPEAVPMPAGFSVRTFGVGDCTVMV